MTSRIAGHNKRVIFFAVRIVCTNPVRVYTEDRQLVRHLYTGRRLPFDLERPKNVLASNVGVSSDRICEKIIVFIAAAVATTAHYARVYTIRPPTVSRSSIVIHTTGPLIRNGLRNSAYRCREGKKRFLVL